MQNNKDKQADLQKVAQALAGDKTSRLELNQQLQSIIEFQTTRLCKRFCQDNYRKYQCSLPGKPTVHAEKVLCEWGNASFGWMLAELMSDKRLQNYKAENNASYRHYCYQVANSVGFYERWKNWRFTRRVYIPAYIEAIDSSAAAVFLGLQSREEVSLMAQKLSVPEDAVRETVRKIVSELTLRNRLYLLERPELVSMTAVDNEDTEIDIAVNDEQEELIEQNQRQRLFAQGWEKLSATERFVLQSLLIEEKDANDVLSVIQQQQNEFPGVLTENIQNRQQLYYIKRKALARLAELMQRNSNAA